MYGAFACGKGVHRTPHPLPLYPLRIDCPAGGSISLTFLVKMLYNKSGMSHHFDGIATTIRRHTAIPGGFAMFYTVTLNPSIDYVVRLKSFTKGITNRTTGEEYYIGGKGINVSCVLKELNIESTAFGFVAGLTGNAIEKGLQRKGIQASFIRLPEGNSRINVKIKATEESEINGQGPGIPEEAFGQLLEQIDHVTDGDTLILGGAIPNTLAGDAYVRILQRVKGKQVRLVVDAAKKLLTDCLKFKPFLIKPNKQELSEIFMKEMTSEQDIIECARELKKMGAKNVIVSLGRDGAMLLSEDGSIRHFGNISGKVLSTVGAGDAMIAGFLAGYDTSGGNYDEAMLLGVACGNATAFSSGLPESAMIRQVTDTMRQQYNEGRVF